jgi:hypothetical protein
MVVVTVPVPPSVEVPAVEGRTRSVPPAPTTRPPTAATVKPTNSRRDTIKGCWTIPRDHKFSSVRFRRIRDWSGQIQPIRTQTGSTHGSIFGYGSSHVNWVFLDVERSAGSSWTIPDFEAELVLAMRRASQMPG